MNHVEKPESFDPEGLRRRLSESRGNASGPAAGGAEEKSVELNSLARQIAEQFRDDSYSPAMITGLLRLCEFGALLALGYFIHALYDGFEITVLYAAVLVGGAAMFSNLLAPGLIHTGERNVLATREALHAAGIPLRAEWVGGDYGRSVELDLATGRVTASSMRHGAREL